MRGRKLAGIVAVVAVVAAGGFVASVASAGGKTVWDGVYTVTQADRGKAIYAGSCQSCHAENLSGGFDGPEQVPALKRENFGISRRDLNNLYQFILESMPRNEPGNLSAAGTTDVIAYILQQNGFPVGPAELKPEPDVLESIQIVPKP